MLLLPPPAGVAVAVGVFVGAVVGVGVFVGAVVGVLVVCRAPGVGVLIEGFAGWPGVRAA